MIIDGHAHACGEYLTSNKIEEYLNKHNIDKVILCSGEPDSDKNYNYPMLSNVFKGIGLSLFFNRIICKLANRNHLSSYIDRENKKVYEISRELPDKVINAYWVNPLESNCVEKLAKFYDKYDFKIVKLHECWTRFKIDSIEGRLIIDWATKNKKPIFIHLLSEDEVKAFVKVANEFKDTSFIVAHMIGADYMHDKLNNINVFFDLSAPQLYSMDIMKRAIGNYGCDRLLLGSDTPYGTNNCERVINRLKKLNLSQENINLICGDNLEKLLFDK